MADIRISELPSAPNAISGSELVPIVQNGQTVKTTVLDLVNSPVQTQTFLTVGNEPSLANSRRIGGGLGIGLVDSGAQGQLVIGLNAVSASLENASTGMIVKNSSTTVVNRSIVSSGSGLSVTNGNGLSGNPAVGLTGLPLALSGITGTGFLTTSGGTSLGTSVITGTSNQITVVGGDGSSIPTISIANNPIISGTGSITIPNGTTGQRSGSYGALRYNSTLGTFEGYASLGWQQFTYSSASVSSFQTSLSGLTPSTSTTGAVTLSGTLGVPSGGTGFSTYATGDLIYASATNTLSKLTAGTNGYVLTLAGGVPTWASSTGGVTSFSGGTTGLTPNTATTGAITLAGTLNAVNGGTGFATYATGDIVYASATNTLSKLTAGTNGYVLTLSSGVPTWAASTGGVTSFQTSLSGLTPSTSSTGAITLAGTLGVTSGGTGLTSVGALGNVLTSNGTTWVSQAPTSTYSSFTPTTQTATSGQTVFNVTYTAPYIMVFLNGVLLNTVDYTATNGTTVVLATGATAGDILDFLTFTTSAMVSAGGSNTQIQYNNSGALAGNANFTYTGNDVNIPYGSSNSASSISRVALAISMMS